MKAENLLISIHPKYVSEIINGNKKYEYRKNIFKREIGKIFIYSTDPEKKIIGYFDYNGYFRETPQKLWEKTCNYSGISEEEYFAYFNKRDVGYAIYIEKFVVLDEPLNPLKIIPNFIAPQSYKYVHGDIFI